MQAFPETRLWTLVVPDGAGENLSGGFMQLRRGEVWTMGIFLSLARRRHERRAAYFAAIALPS